MTSSNVAKLHGSAHGADGENRAEPGSELQLCVLNGTHRGAACEFASNGFVLVGAAEDCDVILTDPDVAQHHCIVTRVDGALKARALDGELHAGGRAIAPGGMFEFAQFEPFALTADVELAVGPSDSERWRALLPEHGDAPRHGAQHQRPLLRWTVAAALGAFLLGGAATALLWSPSLPAQTDTGPQEAVAILQSLKLEDDVRLDAGEVLSLSGVVEDDADLRALRAALDAAGVRAEMHVRTGPGIAHDVAEILRLSGIGVTARYSGDGEVTISGTFGNEEALAEVLGSRAINDVLGLERVVVENLKPLPAEDDEPAQGLPAGKRIVSVVRGADPYVITADGSRYYVGATLPGGGRLHEISGSEVWVDNGEDIVRLDPEETHVNRSAT